MASVSAVLNLTVQSATAPLQPPPQAAAVGFNRLAFFDGPWDLSTIDVNNTGVAGKKWYVEMSWPRASDTGWHSFGITPPEDLSISGNDLVFAPKGPTITLAHCGNICTCRPIATPPYYQGTTFVGGYYAEVLATWPRSEQSTLGEGSWPNAWMWATSFLTSTENVSFEWTEVDIFEAPSGQNVHIWTHVAGQSTSSDSFSSYNPDGIAHSGTKYGMLLVPSQGGNPPRLDLYINDLLKHTFAPTPGKTQAIFDFMANDRQCLILGAGQQNPMTVQSVRVWQA